MEFGGVQTIFKLGHQGVLLDKGLWVAQIRFARM
jgi:hypothetical protein